MKGKILGFTPSTGTGTITGEDGARYGFAAAEWRSDKPIAAGLAVDFEAKGQEAAGIYPVAASGIDVSALGTSPALAKAKALATSNLAFPLAILLLLVSFLPMVHSASMNLGLSLVGLDPLTTELNGRIGSARKYAESRNEDHDELEAKLQKVITETGPQTPTGWYGSGPTAEEALKKVQTDRAKTAADLSEETRGSFLLNFVMLVYAVPVLALALIGACWVSKMVRPLSLAAGGAGIVAFVLVWNVARAGGELISLSFGAWAMLALGIALLAAAFGKIRNPLAGAA